MSMEAIDAIIDRGDTLKTVILYAHPDLPLDVSSIRFVFSQSEFSISVCHDTDQIVIQSQIDPDLTVLDFQSRFQGRFCNGNLNMFGGCRTIGAILMQFSFNSLVVEMGALRYFRRLLKLLSSESSL